MKKCGWKKVLVDGEPEKYVKTGLKFCPCKNFNGIIYWQYFGGKKRYICSACHGDVRKPEEEKPLIVKSGGTYVAYSKDVDYLCTAAKWLEGYRGKIRDEQLIIGYPGYWKSFTGENPDITELTDEIAKLRPMVIIHDVLSKESELRIFTYIDDTILQCKGVTMTIKDLYVRRLATAHELQEAEGC